MPRRTETPTPPAAPTTPVDPAQAFPRTYVQFVPRENGPEKLVMEGELVFGPEYEHLHGMKLVGFSYWRGAEGDIYPTLPSRSFGIASERKYYDYLWSADGSSDRYKQFKQFLLNEFLATPQGAQYRRE
jgi:hypothetical protein